MKVKKWKSYYNFPLDKGCIWIHVERIDGTWCEQINFG